MKVDMSPAAFDDLEAIKKHIEEKLQNPPAAKNILLDIMNSIKSLDGLPERGAPLDTLVSVKSDYRFIQSHNYIIFYRIDESRIIIVRVLYKRRDFMRVFFSSETNADPTDEVSCQS